MLSTYKDFKVQSNKSLMLFLGFLDNLLKGLFSSSELKQVRLVLLSMGADMAEQTNAWQKISTIHPGTLFSGLRLMYPEVVLLTILPPSPPPSWALAPSTALQSDYTLQVFYIRGQLHKEIKYMPIYVFIFRDL